MGKVKKQKDSDLSTRVPGPRSKFKGPLFNREYSWIEFNRRVLAEAANESVPVLERLKFLSICSSNLDEFFMVRVGGLRDLIEAGITERSADGLTPAQELEGIRTRAKQLMTEMYDCLETGILPGLLENGIVIEDPATVSKREKKLLKAEFDQQLAPVLTPLAFDPGHPFPFLANVALNLAIRLQGAKSTDHLVFMKVPSLVPRLVPLKGGKRYVTIESLIAEHVGELFPGLEVTKVVPFRVIRNADFEIKEDEIQHDLLQSVEAELRRRERQEVVWIEFQGDPKDDLVSLLTTATRAGLRDVFCAPNLLKLSDLMQIYGEANRHELKDPPFNPRIPPRLASSEDIFSIIREGDVLLHRPYDSFTAVVEFVQAAAEDPDVRAIKQTLYRSDPDAPIIEALAKAAQGGKQVAAVVELQARFDEMKNITWARRLEEAGVQVVYGILGVKTHGKLCLVVRKEGKNLRRYLHLSTGNYHASTARLYTDIDLFTTDPDLCSDAAKVMNLLTGFSLGSIQQIFDGDTGVKWKKMVVSPMDYHHWTLHMIDREASHARAGKPARIIAKMNALVDPGVISALYRASRAGVQIDLIVRGPCCLVPGIEGTSENIRVTSVIDRFLEHSRIYSFANAGESEVYVSSGDWMPRNFFRRVELTYPVTSEKLKERLEMQILDISLRDNVKGWILDADGRYSRLQKGEEQTLRSQSKFIEIARAEAAKLLPYEEAIKKPAKARRKAKKEKQKKK